MNSGLVSVFAFCKNRVASIERSVQSVLNQSYENIEFVIQDGASSDGTLEVLRRYAQQDSRIKLVSEEDGGPADAFWRVIKRCQGELIASCLSDEELMPNAVEEAVRRFKDDPYLGAITGDALVTDLAGNITGRFIGSEFNLVDYLLGTYCPYFCASFFRHRALKDIGLYTTQWNLECIEFELWCRLATQHEIKYFPGFVAKYAWHADQLGNTAHNAEEHVRGRFAIIERMFSNSGFFGENDTLRDVFVTSQLRHFYNHFKNTGLVDAAARLEKEIDQRTGNDAAGYLRARIHERRGMYFWTLLSRLTPPPIRSAIKQSLKDKVRTRFLHTAAEVEQFARRHTRRLRDSGSAAGPSPVGPSQDAVNALAKLHICRELGHLYERRGQIDQALQYWRIAEGLNDRNLDSIYCSTILKSPTATHLDLLDWQQNWAARHVKTLQPRRPLEITPQITRRKVTIAYHSSLWSADYVLYQILPFIRNHNRDRFLIVGYSYRNEAPEITKHFDKFNILRDPSDADFVEIVRGDRVDILVEVNGFSPGHRFAAMAARCAPVQLHYANHHGTSGIPNVDYLLADWIAAPAGTDRYFTEKIHRLPGSFFCFNYDQTDLPPVVDPPNMERGYITFGCFGSGGKINSRLIEWWAEILNRVPRSKMFIRNSQLATANNREYLVELFGRSGVPEDRVIALGPTHRNGVLRCYADVDISLDTFPYCGGNTIAESLYQGVPVITLRGERIASCYGSSILQASGCYDLIATSAGAYIDIAVKLAADRDRLLHYRRNLRAMVREHGFSDAEAFARKLEAAYEEMLRRALEDQMRQPISA